LAQDGEADRGAAARRIDMALALLEAGGATEACELAAEACSLDPGWPDAWFVLGETSERTGAREPAIDAYRRCLALEPQDRLGAGARLTLLGAAVTPDRLPNAYVRTLFDQIARRFEESLVGRLEYRAPERLMQALDAFRADMPSPLAVLDIGCGTGLAGTLLRPWAARLDGFDLSPLMVAEARRKNIYDAVAVADLLDAPVADAPRYGLAVAADVLCYVGDLAPAFAAIRARLIGRGHLAFTVESGSGAPYALGPAQRFRHDPQAIEHWLAGAGFERLACERAVLRRERREPVDGLVVIARLKH
jgi:predicted TPR repeat methyltransferase